MSPDKTTSPSVIPSRASTPIFGAILFLLPFAIYWNTLKAPFFFDDPAAILNNPTIRHLSALGHVLSPPNDGSGASGRPIINLSLAINYALGGTSVMGYHLSNILFHALASLALFGIVRRSLLAPRLAARFGDAALPIAFFCAATWCVHPLQTESVTCVIQRTELLVGLFYFLTLYCFTRAVVSASPPGRWLGLSITACLLGMASKEVMVSAPLMVFLFDRTFFAGSFSEAWRLRRLYYMGLGATLLLLTFLVVRTGGARGEAAGFGLGITWWSYALKQCEAILLYLRLSIWPHPLVVFYGVDVVHDPSEVWVELLVLTSLVAAVLVALRKTPILGFLGMWFFAILAPSSSVVPLVSQTISEHRMYLPLAAPAVLGILFLHILAGRRGWPTVGVALFAFAATSIQRTADYRDDMTIWRDTVAKAPRNARARINLGSALQAEGHHAAALSEYQTALKLDPNLPEALNNIASLAIHFKKPAEALDPCRRALDLKPNFALAHNNLGLALMQIGRADEGIAHLRTALRLQPTLAEAHCNLTSALTDLGLTTKAIEHGERAITLNPRMAIAHFFLATAYIRNNEPARAMAALQTAVRLQPDHAEAQSNLGSLHYQAGDAAKAIPCFQAALNIKPNFADAHNNMAAALFQIGRPNEAIPHYSAAIRLQPDTIFPRLNLALVLTHLGRTDEAITEYEAVVRLAPDNATARAALEQLRTNRQ